MSAKSNLYKKLMKEPLTDPSKVYSLEHITNNFNVILRGLLNAGTTTEPTAVGPNTNWDNIDSNTFRPVDNWGGTDAPLEDAFGGQNGIVMTMGMLNDGGIQFALNSHSIAVRKLNSNNKDWKYAKLNLYDPSKGNETQRQINLLESRLKNCLTYDKTSVDENTDWKQIKVNTVRPVTSWKGLNSPKSSINATATNNQGKFDINNGLVFTFSNGADNIVQFTYSPDYHIFAYYYDGSWDISELPYQGQLESDEGEIGANSGLANNNSDAINTLDSRESNDISQLSYQTSNSLSSNSVLISSNSEAISNVSLVASANVNSITDLSNGIDITNNSLNDLVGQVSGINNNLTNINPASLSSLSNEASTLSADVGNIDATQLYQISSTFSSISNEYTNADSLVSSNLSQIQSNSDSIVSLSSQESSDTENLSNEEQSISYNLQLSIDSNSSSVSSLATNGIGNPTENSTISNNSENIDSNSSSISSLANSVNNLSTTDSLNQIDIYSTINSVSSVAYSNYTSNSNGISSLNSYIASSTTDEYNQLESSINNVSTQNTGNAGNNNDNTNNDSLSDSVDSNANSIASLISSVSTNSSAISSLENNKNDFGYEHSVTNAMADSLASNFNFINSIESQSQIFTAYLSNSSIGNSLAQANTDNLQYLPPVYSGLAKDSEFTGRIFDNEMAAKLGQNQYFIKALTDNSYSDYKNGIFPHPENFADGLFNSSSDPEFYGDLQTALTNYGTIPAFLARRLANKDSVTHKIPLLRIDLPNTDNNTEQSGDPTVGTDLGRLIESLEGDIDSLSSEVNSLKNK